MFSKATEYALRATIFIAQKGTAGSKVPLGDIAKAIDSPPSFTAKILQQLTENNRIISSVRGPNGGFFLTRRAQNLPVRAILDALGEDDIFRKCVLGLKLCSEVNPCPMHEEYKIIKQQIIELFNKKSILNLADEISTGAATINNRMIYKVHHK